MWMERKSFSILYLQHSLSAAFCSVSPTSGLIFVDVSVKTWQMRTHLLWILSYSFGPTPSLLWQESSEERERTSRLMVSELCTLLILRLQSEKTSCPEDSFPGNLIELTVSSPDETLPSMSEQGKNKTKRNSTNALSYFLSVCEVYKHYCWFLCLAASVSS